MTTHDILWKYREKYQYTQAEMAKLIGISQPHYCDIENGGKSITPDVAIAIEKATEGEIDAAKINKTIKKARTRG